MPKIVVEKGIDKGKSFSVAEDSIVIGRDTTAQIPLSDNMISRLHLKIESRPEGYYLIDMDSSNGTFVNGRRVHEQILKPGDIIQVGETVLSFTAEEIEVTKDSLIGETIAGYRVLERVGRGGMGTVYKSIQLSLNRVVALKVLAPAMTHDKNFIKQFIQEARAAARLNHHNIVQVFDVGRVIVTHPKDTLGTTTEVYYFSMEYIPYGSLHTLLSKQKKLDHLLATKMVIDAAKGLQYAERESIVHRDIKPDNLMIGEDNLLKIGDLGIALVKTSAQPGIPFVCGTAHYVAPEQALGKIVDSRADIYSLGATFYRMVTGVPPFTGPSVKEILTKKAKEEAPSPIAIDPTLPNQLVTVIRKMIRRNPNERYQNIAELLRDLEDLRKQLLAAASVDHPAALPRKQSGIRNSILRILALVVLLSLGGLAIFLFIRHYKKPVGPNNASSQNPPNRVTITSPHEEKLALQYFREALQFEREYIVSPDNIELVLANSDKALQLYEKIIYECSHASVVPETHKKIKALNDRIERLKIEKIKEARGKSAHDSFNTIKKSFGERRNRLLDTLETVGVSSFIERVRIDLKELKKEYTDTRIPNQVDDQLAEINKWYARYQQAAEKWNRLLPQVEDQAKEHHFKTACELINQFLDQTDCQDTIYDRIALDYLLRIQKMAEETFSFIKDEVTRLHTTGELGNLEQARQILITHLNNYGTTALEKGLQKLLNQIDDSINQYLQKEDKLVFDPVFIQSLWLTQTNDPKSAFKLLAKIEPRLKSTKYKQKYQRVINQFDWEEHIIAFLKKHINKGTMRQARLRGNLVKAAHKTGISAMIGSNPNNTVTFPWHEISAKEIHDLVQQHPKLTPSEFIGLGVVCLHRGGLVKQGQSLLNQARSAIKKTPNSSDQILLSVINQYLTQSYFIPDQREVEARLILDQAQTYFLSQQKKPALNNYLLLKHRYSDTKLYKDKSGFIRKRIGYCR